MKMIIRTMSLAFFLSLSLLACNNEELFQEPTALSALEDSAANPATTPCAFQLSDLKANSTFIINCVLDLRGTTLNIPKNVKIIYEGGQVINGTLNFSANDKISAELLNPSLIMIGAKPEILGGEEVGSGDEYIFNPKESGIIEGKVSDAVARKNRDILISALKEAKQKGISTFRIDKMDAYFKVDGPLNQGVPETHGIILPSDLNLEMTQNTHIRMQPHGHFRASLISVYNVKNITIKGGFLHGEREEHNYNSGYVDSDGAKGKTNEWVDCMRITGGKNITIENVTFQDATGDNLNISGIYHYYDSRHIKSENITIRNNTFLRARRTNIVITSGEQIFIENNAIEDGGIDMAKSKGTAPSSNINFEPTSGKNAAGNVFKYQKVSDVYIRNNRQIVNDKKANPRSGGFQISHGNGPIIIENNEMINTGVGFITTNGVIIRNNNILQGSISAGAAENFGRTDVVYGNEVYGNTVVTDATPISIAGNGTLIRDNSFEGQIGVTFGAGAKEIGKGASNMIFKSNIIKAKNTGILTSNTIQNVTIESNTIEMMPKAPFAIKLGNTWRNSESSNFVFKNNTLLGNNSGNKRGAPPSLIGANSLSIENNKMGPLQFNEGRNINVFNNEIEASIGKDGILFYDDVPNTKFRNNVIIIFSSKTPLKIDCVKLSGISKLSSTVLFENQKCINN